jgi:UDP-glucose 4-epimerase
MRIPQEVDRPDASGISCVKAAHLSGWKLSRSWHDLLDDDGRLRPEVGKAVAASEAGVQRGRRAIS